MKKFIIFGLLIALLLSACSSGTPGTATTARSVETTKAPESTEVVITTTEAAATTTEAIETTTEAIETTAAPSLSKEEAIDEYLNGAWDALHETSPDDSFSHMWNDGNLFIEIRTEPVDYFYKNWDDLDDEMKVEVIDLVDGFVAGGFAEPLYRGIRERGGDDFSVYFILVGEVVYAVSCNLRTMSNVFVR